MNINTDFEKTITKIIFSYKIFSNLINEHIKDKKDINYAMNTLYKSLYNELIEQYTDIMQNVEEIAKRIREKYNIENTFMIIEYLEYIFNKTYYNVFVEELKKVEKVRYEHLCVFEYIMKIEIHKIKMYDEMYEKEKEVYEKDTNETIKKTIINRKKVCKERIEIAMNKIKTYNIEEINQYCEEILKNENYKLENDDINDISENKILNVNFP